jgi:threonine dehydratase
MDSPVSTGVVADDDAVSISLSDIEAAAARIKGIIRSTPLLESKTLARRFGGRVFIKSEGFQLTGSFKIRGIYNLLAQMPGADRNRGIVARSAGNLGKSVAATAAHFQAPCTIFMPMDAEPTKVDSIRRLGADVIFYNRFQDDSKALSRSFAEQHRAFIVKRTANAQIISGHGTVGLEIAEDFERRGVTPDLALVPCGSGGLIAGVATALKARWPSIEIIACQPEGYRHTAPARAANRFNESATASWICDALMAAATESRAIARIKNQLVDRSVDVTEHWILPAMKIAALKLKLVTEPSGAIALAALLAGLIRLRGRTAVILLTGANVEAKLLARALNMPDV